MCIVQIVPVLAQGRRDVDQEYIFLLALLAVVVVSTWVARMCGALGVW